MVHELGSTWSRFDRFQVNNPRVDGWVTLEKLRSLVINQSTTEVWKLSSSQGVCDVQVDDPGTYAAAVNGEVGRLTEASGIWVPVDGLVECTLRM